MKRFIGLFLSACLGMGSSLLAAPLEVGGSGDVSYASTAELNAALSGYDSLKKVGTSTLTFNATPAAVVGTSLIDVTAGTMNWNSTSPTTDRTAHLFHGTVNVASGASLILAVKNALGYESNEANRITLNVSGTLDLNGQEQTLRAVTLNLSGATVTSGQFDYRTDAAVIRALSGNSSVSSTLNVRVGTGAAATPTITVDSDASLNWTGRIRSENSTAPAITKAGGGTLTISNESAYGSGWNVTAGTLQYGAAQSSSAPLTIASGAFADLNGQSVTVGTLSGEGSIQNHSTTATAFTVSGTSDCVSTVRIGESTNGTTYGKISVVKAGSGTWTIRPTTSVWNVDSFTVNGGTVEFDQSLGAKSRFLATTFEINDGGTLFLNAWDALGSQAAGGNLTFNVNRGGTLKAIEPGSSTSPNNQTCRGMTMNLAGGKMDGGTFYVQSTTSLNSLASSVTSTVNSRIAIREGNATFNVADGEAAIDLSFTRGIIAADSSPYAFIKAGAGLMEFAAQNSYSGLTQVTGGTLQLGTANAILPTSKGLELASGTTFNLAGFDQTLTALTGDGNVTNSAAAASTLTLTGNGAFSGTVGSGVKLVKTGTGTITFSTSANWNAESLSIEQGTVQKGSSSTQRFIKQIRVADGATLELLNPDALGGGSNGPTLARTYEIAGTLSVTAHGIANNQTTRYATLNLYGGKITGSDDIGLLMLVSGTNNSINAKAKNPDGSDVTRTSSITGLLTTRSGGDNSLLFDVEDSKAAIDLNWTGSMANEKTASNPNAVRILKQGAGTMSLTGSFFTTAGAQVSDGTLILDGAKFLSKADGTAFSGVTVDSGAAFSAVNGSRVGTLAMNGDYLFTLADLTADSLTASSVVFGTDATAGIDLTGWNPDPGYSASLLTVTNGAEAAYSALASLLASDPAMAFLNLSLGTNGVISLSANSSALPEPASWLLLLAGLGVLFRKSIRKNCRS